jgi:hypothetical protein
MISAERCPMPVRDLADVERMEVASLETWDLPRTTYEVFAAGAQRHP